MVPLLSSSFSNVPVYIEEIVELMSVLARKKGEISVGIKLANFFESKASNSNISGNKKMNKDSKCHSC